MLTINLSVQILKTFWRTRSIVDLPKKKVEERFLEVDKEGQDPVQMAPNPKKRKTATKEVQPGKADPMPDMQQSFKLFFFFF